MNKQCAEIKGVRYSPAVLYHTSHVERTTGGQHNRGLKPHSKDQNAFSEAPEFHGGTLNMKTKGLMQWTSRWIRL